MSCALFEPGDIAVKAAVEEAAVDEFRDAEGTITEEGCFVLCEDVLPENYANLVCDEGDTLDDGTVEIVCQAKSTCPAAVGAST